VAALGRLKERLDAARARKAPRSGATA